MVMFLLLAKNPGIMFMALLSVNKFKSSYKILYELFLKFSRLSIQYKNDWTFALNVKAKWA